MILANGSVNKKAMFTQAFVFFEFIFIMLLGLSESHHLNFLLKVMVSGVYISCAVCSIQMYQWQQILNIAIKINAFEFDCT